MTRTRRIAFAVGLLATFLAIVSVPLWAQTHPCDQPPPAQGQIASGAPHKLQFCQRQSDQIEAIVAYVDGAAFDLLPVTAKTAPSATGMILYETGLFLQVARGTHVLTVAAYNRNVVTGALQLGASTPPFTFTAVDDTPLPSVPAILGVLR